MQYEDNKKLNVLLCSMVLAGVGSSSEGHRELKEPKPKLVRRGLHGHFKSL